MCDSGRLIQTGFTCASRKGRLGVLCKITFERHRAHDDSKLNTRTQNEGCSITKCRYLTVSHTKVAYKKSPNKRDPVKSVIQKTPRKISEQNKFSFLACWLRTWCKRSLRQKMCVQKYIYIYIYCLYKLILSQNEFKSSTGDKFGESH